MKNVALILLMFASLLNGCDESNPVATSPNNQDTTKQTGEKGIALAGYAYLLTDCKREADHSGIRVSVPGTNLSTLTDANGFWVIDSVTQGVSSFRYTKDGYYTREQNIAIRKTINDTSYTIDQSLAKKRYYDARFEGKPKIERWVDYVYRDSLAMDSNGVRVKVGDIVTDSIVYTHYTFSMLGLDEQGIPDATIRPVLLISNHANFDPLTPSIGMWYLDAHPRSGKYPYYSYFTSLELQNMGLKSGDKFYVAPLASFRCPITFGGGNIYSAKAPTVREFIVP